MRKKKCHGVRGERITKSTGLTFCREKGETRIGTKYVYRDLTMKSGEVTAIDLTTFIIPSLAL